jgi:hypothetical protein
MGIWFCKKNEKIEEKSALIWVNNLSNNYRKDINNWFININIRENNKFLKKRENMWNS